MSLFQVVIIGLLINILFFVVWFGAPVAMIDVASTSLELAGVREASLGQGRSLVPLLAAGGSPDRRAVFSSLWASVAPSPGSVGERIAFRVDRDGSSVIVDSRFGETAFLYDWNKDPAQAVNLAKPGSEVMRSLKRVYESAGPMFDERRLTPDNMALPDDVRDKLRALGYEPR